MSKLFDNADVYRDTVHVNERGNKMIADAVWDDIKGKVLDKNIKKRKKSKCT